MMKVQVRYTMARGFPTISWYVLDVLLLCALVSGKYTEEETTSIEISTATTIIPTVPSNSITTTTPRDVSPLDDEMCGTVDNNVFLIVNGEDTKEGKWPWIAAIYKHQTTKNSGHNSVYQCGGVLITVKHVITAGHCMQWKNLSAVMDREEILVKLGRHNLDAKTESEEARYGVEKLYIHPTWNVRGQYDGDLALLVLDRRVEFNSRVRPACWFHGSRAVNKEKERLVGTVVGWGDIGDGSVSNTPQIIQMPIVEDQKCSESDFRFKTLLTNITFCAGSQNGAGPCRGDSGSGFYSRMPSPKHKEERWEVLGLVSRALIDDEKRCDLSKFVVFTDLVALKPWLVEYVKRDLPEHAGHVIPQPSSGSVMWAAVIFAALFVGAALVACPRIVRLFRDHRGERGRNRNGEETSLSTEEVQIQVHRPSVVTQTEPPSEDKRAAWKKKPSFFNQRIGSIKSNSSNRSAIAFNL